MASRKISDLNDAGALTGSEYVAVVDFDACGTVKRTRRTTVQAIADLAAAAGDMTGAEILAALLAVDGSGSALDADMVDGIHGSALQPLDAILTDLAGITFAQGDPLPPRN